MIRKARLSDAKAIVDIYNYYIKETTITFEIDELTPQDMQERIEKTHNCGYPFIVYEENGELVGYAYVRKWRESLIQKHFGNKCLCQQGYEKKWCGKEAL